MNVECLAAKTRTINGFEVPAPETEEPDYDTMYWLTSTVDIYFYSYVAWFGNDEDKRWLERGLVFLNKEDAAANAKAMLGIDPNKPSMGQPNSELKNLE